MNVGIRQLAFREKQRVPVSAEISIREKFMEAFKRWDSVRLSPTVPKEEKRKVFSEFSVLAEQIIKLNQNARELAA